MGLEPPGKPGRYRIGIGGVLIFDSEGRLISTHNLFIWEVVKAHVATSPKYPETFHYRGDGVFMISGRSINLSRKFKPENL